MKSLLILYALISGLIPKEVPYRQLVWDDFRGPINSNHTALTTTVMEIETTDSAGRCYFKVSALFLPNESFTTTDREDILRHEQTHFDICEMLARECTQKLLPYQGCRSSQREKVNTIFERYSRNLTRLQSTYDRDTRHSMNEIVQKIWERNISNDLKKLE